MEYYATAQKNKGRFVWIDMEWFVGHIFMWEKQSTKEMIVYYLSYKKCGDMRKYTPTCPFVWNKHRNDKPESKDIAYL